MKTIEEILREQVAELTKLLELKEKRIAELEVLMAVKSSGIVLPFQGATCSGGSK